MMPFPRIQEITRFRTQVSVMMGLYFDESRFSTLAKVLHNRMLAFESSPVVAPALGRVLYLDWLETNPAEEIRILARELTVTETYFLRNMDQFHALIEVALPARLALRSGKVALLSAGCASGEEPYSMAIALREHAAHVAERVSIHGIDLNPAMLQKAARARYSNWSLRDLSDQQKQRWFSVDGDAFKLNETIHGAVAFESRNLTRDNGDFWLPGRFDIVFCRNVLMYFSLDQARAALDRIAGSIAPGGFLFLGHAETLRGLSNDFHLCHTNGTFYYQRRQEPVGSLRSASQPQLSAERFPALALSDTSWVEAIQLASDRIHALTPDWIVPVGTGLTLPAMLQPLAPNLQHVLASMHSEQYDHSLHQIEDLLNHHARDPDILLLKAISLSLSGALAAAEIVCDELLSCDEFNPGAHYVLALCREGVGDLEGAARHDQTATYLDAGFAMPRLHLGLLARRKHDRDAAREHLMLALQLLRQEDPARVLLFGGGFKREALVALCNAELAGLAQSKGATN